MNCDNWEPVCNIENLNTVIIPTHWEAMNVPFYPHTGKKLFQLCHLLNVKLLFCENQWAVNCCAL